MSRTPRKSAGQNSRRGEAVAVRTADSPMKVVVTSTRGWTKAAKDALELAMDLGWHVARTTGRGAVLLHHDDGEGRMTLTPRLNSQGRAYENVISQLRQHGTLTQALAEERANGDVVLLERTMNDIGLGEDESAADAIRKVDMHRLEKNRAFRRGPRPQNLMTETPPKMEIPVTPASLSVVKGDKPGERTVVETGPWMARNSMSSKGGILYPSSAVTERHWSDGAVDYACPAKGCDFTADKPRSVANHFGAKHSSAGAHEVARQGTFLDPNVTWEVNPRRDAAIHRLTREIEAAMAEGAITAEELAKAIVLERIRVRGSASEVEAEVLTDADIVLRIRRLVDTGQLATMETEVENLTAEKAALEAENVRLSQEAGTYRGRWTALRDIITDEDANLAPITHEETPDAEH